MLRREEKGGSETVQKRCRSEQDTPVWLSVVVIGRNEGKTLPALFQSLPAAGDIEWIYVDSVSYTHLSRQQKTVPDLV